MYPHFEGCNCGQNYAVVKFLCKMPTMPSTGIVLNAKMTSINNGMAKFYPGLPALQQLFDTTKMKLL